MKDTYLIFGVVAVMVLGFLGIAYLGDKNQQVAVVPDERVAIQEGDWVAGPADAKAVLVEYSDFQCPACGQYYSLLKDIKKEFEGKIAFVYRHFPLVTIHRNAEPAAHAAEAAGLQGKFWEMHDMLFEKQPEWSELSDPSAAFARYAAELKLDATKFSADVKSDAVKEKVTESFRKGNALGISSTPTFYLNTVKLQNNPRSAEEFRALITKALGE